MVSRKRKPCFNFFSIFFLHPSGHPGPGFVIHDRSPAGLRACALACRGRSSRRQRLRAFPRITGNTGSPSPLPPAIAPLHPGMIQDHRQAFPPAIYTGNAFRLWLSVRRNPAAIRQRPHDMPPCSLRPAFRFCFGNIQAAAGQILFIDPGTFCRSDHRGPKAATPPACTPPPPPPGWVLPGAFPLSEVRRRDRSFNNFGKKFFMV